MDENDDIIPVCPVCGQPVRQRDTSGAYRGWHVQCDSRMRAAMDAKRRARQAGELDERLRYWSAMLTDATGDIRISVIDRNTVAAERDHWAAVLTVERCRQAILAMRMTPDEVNRYRDPWLRRLCADIGRDGMDLIADRVGWSGARPWRKDPAAARDGTLHAAGQLPVPADPDTREGYRGDLDRAPGAALTVMGALDHIWKEDNTGTPGEPGPWRLR